MARTITGGYTITPTITSAITLIGSDNPLLITTGAEGAMGTIVGTAFGISGDASQTWTITNQGAVHATGAGTIGVGISLAGAGLIQNTGTTSEITGYSDGVILGDVGTVGNEGTISGGTGAGVRLDKGGSVTTGAGTETTAASITGAVGVQIGYAGYVGPDYLAGGAGTVLNTGIIDGTATRGVHLKYGGSVGNYGSIHGYLDGILTWWQATTVTNDGTIIGHAGVRLFDAAGTVTNTGTIFGSYGHGIYLGAGGSVSNGGTVFAYGWGTGIAADGVATVSNTGTIDGAGGGVRLQAGGTVSNLGTDASISGYDRGVGSYYGGTVINEGRIASTYDAVTIDGGGQVTNAASGTITGGTGIRGGGDAVTVSNAGTVTGTAGSAMYLAAGGTVLNSGMVFGTVGAGDDASLDNTGTIDGGTGNAVQLDGGGTVTNGNATLTSTLITSSAGDGVRIGNSGTSVGTVTNHGTIAGGYSALGPSYATDTSGIRLLDGGLVTNGGTGNTAAHISGSVGVQTGHYYNRYPDRGFEGVATVQNFGTIIGIDRAGVGLYGGGTLLNSGFVTGYSQGVNGAWTVPFTVFNDGTITGTGTYSSSDGVGVFLSYAGATVTNGSPTNHAALIHGANYGVTGQDDTTVVNHATISSGVYGAVELNSGTVDNAAGGVIAGAEAGIYLLRAGQVTNEGSIAGGTGAGVRLKGGTLLASGTVTGTAQIEGTIGADIGYLYVGTYGTYSSGPGTVLNGGTVIGHAAGPMGYGFDGESGIGVVLRDGGSVGNGGYIYGDYAGIRLVNTAGTVGNTGTIVAQYYGIQIRDAAADVTNQGTILAPMGIVLEAGGTVANLGTAATISGAGIGIYFRSGGGTGTVTNEGTISGQYAVYLHDGGSLTNSGTASALGSPGESAVRAGGAAAVTIGNDGTIAGYEHGILMFGGGTITNGSTANAGATIGAYNSAAIAAYTQATTVVNYGSITSTYGSAIYLEAGGSVANAAGAVIAGATIGGGYGPFGYTSGVYSMGDAAITNSGTIVGIVGIFLPGGTITNAGTAALIGGFVGVLGTPGGSAVTIGNEGTIGGLAGGIGLASGGTVTNTGTAALIQGGSVGMQVAGIVTIRNEGTITGGGPAIAALYGRTRLVNGSATDTTALISGEYGVLLVAAAGAVTNFGTISGDYSGVAFQSRRGVVTNRGLIEASGSSGTGYGVVLGKGGTVTNTGAIIGTYGVVAGYPCGCSPGGAATLTNKGTIIGTGGVAVQLGDYDDMVAVGSRAAFAGTVIAGDGHDILSLLAGGPAGTIAGLGGVFTGFEEVTRGAGASWSLAGSNTLADGSTIDGAGLLTVRGDLSVPGTLHIEGSGTLAAGATGSIEIGGAGGGVAGRILVDAGGTLSGNGVLKGAITDRGLIEAAGGTLTTLGNVGGSGTIAISAGAVLDARANLSVRHIVFAGAGTDETLLAANADRLVGTIAGFADHDAIDLTGFLADPLLTAFAGDVLTLHELGGPGTVALHFAPGHSLADFVVAPDSGSGTLITHL